MEGKSILVVSEKSPSTLECVVDRPEGAELIFCTDSAEAVSAELMLAWGAVDEVVVVGPLETISLRAVIDHAEHLGAPIRRWQKPTVQ